MKLKTPAKEGKEGIKFEEALKRLEEIVHELESGDLPLEEILKKYEEGNKLSQVCASKLNEAEQRIEILMKDKNGSLTLKPFEDAEEGESGEEAEKGNDGKVVKEEKSPRKKKEDSEEELF